MTKRLDIFELFAEDEVVPEFVTTAGADSATLAPAEAGVARRTAPDGDGAR